MQVTSDTAKMPPREQPMLVVPRFRSFRYLFTSSRLHSFARTFGERRAAACALATLLLTTACGREHASPVAPADSTQTLAQLSFSAIEAGSAALTSEPKPFSTPTYDGSGQSVHPDIMLFPAAWHGSRMWVSLTPYPFGNSGFENPSLYVSSTGTSVQVPSGVVNPLVPMPFAPNYNSDPDLTYDPHTDRLVMAYRVAGGPSNQIMVMSSGDGQSWTVPHLAFSAYGNGAVSPSMLPARDGHPAMAWYVDAGTAGCGATSTRVMVRRAASSAVPLDSVAWQDGVATDLTQPGYVVWHMKVEYVPSFKEYWALYVAYPADGGSCQDDDLFLARSADGVHWQTYSRAVLRHELRAWTAGALYRSSFVYDPTTDALRVWLSGVDVTAVWHVGYAQFRLSSLLAQLAAPAHKVMLTSLGLPSSGAPVRSPGPRWSSAP